jgi:hypothetical protein
VKAINIIHIRVEMARVGTEIPDDDLSFLALNFDEDGDWWK